MVSVEDLMSCCGSDLAFDFGYSVVEVVISFFLNKNAGSKIIERGVFSTVEHRPRQPEHVAGNL